MGILDKFKSQKEQEIQQKSAATGAKAKSDAAPKQAKSGKAGPGSAESKAKKPEAVVMSEAHQGVLLSPVVTEKSATLASQGKYVFNVRPDANRIQVAAAVKAVYGVTPESVNIQNVRGKRVRFGRTIGRRNDWKKAIVNLPEGKAIEVYEGV